MFSIFEVFFFLLAPVVDAHINWLNGIWFKQKDGNIMHIYDILFVGSFS